MPLKTERETAWERGYCIGAIVMAEREMGLQWLEFLFAQQLSSEPLSRGLIHDHEFQFSACYSSLIFCSPGDDNDLCLALPSWKPLTMDIAIVPQIVTSRMYIGRVLEISCNMWSVSCCTTRTLS